MARELKPQKVDEVKNTVLGVAVDIMLDRNTLTFFARLPNEGAKVEGDTAVEVKNEVEKKLKLLLDLTWVSVIVVGGLFKRDTAFTRDEPGLKITAVRGQLAESPNGLRWIGWEQRDEAPDYKAGRSTAFWFHRNTGPLALPLNEGRDFEIMGKPQHENGERRTLIAYNEETWIALQGMIDAIDAARAEIIRLVTTDDGREQMRVVGAAALPLLIGAGEPSTAGGQPE